MVKLQHDDLAGINNCLKKFRVLSTSKYNSKRISSFGKRNLTYISKLLKKIIIMEQNNIFVPSNEFQLNTAGYADLLHNENPIESNVKINKLSALSCETNSNMVDFKGIWLIRHLRQFCKKRREGNFPAIEKFRISSMVDLKRIFYVDLLLKPKIVADTFAMDYLQFSAQIKSSEPQNYYAHFGVSILNQQGDAMWSTSSTKGAAFSDSRSFRTQLVPITCLFTDNEPSNLVIKGDLHLSIDLKVRICPLPLDPILNRELSKHLADSNFGDFKIVARYRSFHVHRHLLEKYDLFANIRSLHPYQQEIDLKNWNQDQIVGMLSSMYMAEGLGRLAEIDH